MSSKYLRWVVGFERFGKKDKEPQKAKESESKQGECGKEAIIL